MKCPHCSLGELRQFFKILVEAPVEWTDFSKSGIREKQVSVQCKLPDNSSIIWCSRCEYQKGLAYHERTILEQS